MVGPLSDVQGLKFASCPEASIQLLTHVQPVAPTLAKMASAQDEVLIPAGCVVLLLIDTKSGSDLIHIVIAHGRGLHDRYMSFVFLNLGCKRHAGASRADHGKHKHRFPHGKYTPHPASPSR